MALALNGPVPGKLLDPTGGNADLRAGIIRILHDQSFRDDATRVLRAIRDETRFGFRLEAHTLDLLSRSLPFLDTISGTRIRHELQRTLDEPEPEHSLNRMADLGVLAAIHPSLAFDTTLEIAFRRLRDLVAPIPAAYWPLIFWNSASQVDSLTNRLALSRTQSEALITISQLQQLASGGQAAILSTSALATRLDPFPKPNVWALASITRPPFSDRILDYLIRLSHLHPILRGNDIIALGVPRGPHVAEVLTRLRAAKLDGGTTTRADEEHLVCRYLESIA